MLLRPLAPCPLWSGPVLGQVSPCERHAGVGSASPAEAALRPAAHKPTWRKGLMETSEHDVSEVTFVSGSGVLCSINFKKIFT